MSRIKDLIEENETYRLQNKNAFIDVYFCLIREYKVPNGGSLVDTIQNHLDRKDRRIEKLERRIRALEKNIKLFQGKVNV